MHGSKGRGSKHSLTNLDFLDPHMMNLWMNNNLDFFYFTISARANCCLGPYIGWCDTRGFQWGVHTYEGTASHKQTLMCMGSSHLWMNSLLAGSKPLDKASKLLMCRSSRFKLIEMHLITWFEWKYRYPVLLNHSVFTKISTRAMSIKCHWKLLLNQTRFK